MSKTCAHPDDEALEHLDCEGCRTWVRDVLDSRVSWAPPWVWHGQRLEFYQHPSAQLSSNRAEIIIVDDANLSRPLLAVDVDLSDILATRIVLEDHREQWGSEQPEVRARLEAMLVDEVLVLARTDEERAAVREVARPGTWFGDENADGRSLTQGDTDMLVRCELWMSRPASKIFDVGEFDSVPANRNIRLALGTCGRRMYGERYALKQRGGIDSDPLVRLLAWRAWGERDRDWGDVQLDRDGDVVGGRGIWSHSTPYCEGDLLRSYVQGREETVRVVAVEPSNAMYVASNGARSPPQRDPPPVPKWAKAKRARERPPGR